MTQPNSESWQIDELSPGDEVFSNVQVKSENDPFDMFGSGSDEEYSLQTPEQKFDSRKVGSQDHISETYMNSGNGSSDISIKEGSEAMSSSSSLSEAEFASCLPVQKYMTLQVNDGEVLQPKMIDIEADTFDMKENLHAPETDREAMVKEKDMLYQKLLEKVTNYESELKFSKAEIAKLKYENLTLVGELDGTKDKLRISEDLKKELEINFRNEFLEVQNNLQAKIDVANDSALLLEAELDTERNRGSELREMIEKASNDLIDYYREVNKLKVALHDAHKDFSKDNAVLQEQNSALKTRLNEFEMRNKMLDEQIKRYETEKTEIRKHFEAREANLLNMIKQFQIEDSEKTILLESLNKSLDDSKLKYDMLMSEKDETFAKLETLQAEIRSRDINIQQLEGHISRLSTEEKDLVAKSQKTEKLAEELSKELKKQKVSTCEREDEKREAIRQLCLSIEYYRTEFHELRQALLKHKRPAVTA